MKINIFIFRILLFLNFHNCYLSFLSNCVELKSYLKLNINNINNNKVTRYEDKKNTQIKYFEGWIKYFYFTLTNKEKPKSFFKNKFYKKKSKNDTKYSMEITSENMFYSILYKDALEIFNAKNETVKI